MSPPDRSTANLLLGTAAFTISSAGSVLLHIVLAFTVYNRTGSGLVTSMFICLQWLPALLVVLVRNNWDHGLHPRTRWMLLDLAAAALTLPALLFTAGDHYLALVTLLLVRGVFDQANRINRTVAARVLFAADKVTGYASFLQTSYHVGIGLAAVIGITLMQHLNLSMVVLLDAMTYLVSAALIWFTRCVVPRDNIAIGPRTPLATRIAEYRDALKSDHRLLVCALLMPLTATFFQGTYSVLQPIFPIRRLHLGAEAVSTSYVLASMAIVAGSALFSYLCARYRLFERPFAHTRHVAMALALGTAALYVAAAWVAQPLVCAALFTLMIAGFEFLWMMGYGGTVAFAPKGQLGSVFGISFAIGCFLASMLAALVGALLDHLGDDFVVLVGSLMALFSAAILYLLARDPGGARSAPGVAHLPSDRSGSDTGLAPVPALVRGQARTVNS